MSASRPGLDVRHWRTSLKSRGCLGGERWREEAATPQAVAGAGGGEEKLISGAAGAA